MKLDSSSGENAAKLDLAEDAIFSRIATRYDFLCDVFSLMIHRSWKNKMAKKISELDSPIVLDVASGTGDIPLRVLRKSNGSKQKIIACDLCPEMLAIARSKFKTSSQVEFKVLDARNMEEIETDSIDLYSISFGMKILDRTVVLKEAIRVLKPGGVFLCLEAARIPVPFLHKLYLKYMDWCLPIMGWIASRGDASSYEYLLRGVHDFPEQKDFVSELKSIGFEGVSYKNFTFGIVALHEGRKRVLA